MTIETICLNATWITFDSIYFKYLVTITTYISITDTDFFKIRLTILCHLVSDYSESKIIIAFLQEAKQIPCIIYICKSFWQICKLCTSTHTSAQTIMTKKLPQISLPVWNGVYYTSPPQKRDHTKGYEEASETSRLNNIHFVICLHKMGQWPQS